uniref:thioesterase domain-containing protein n=1 Tax=uncultured Aquimarina sp. TaxID=575652 RepID=UPI002616CD8F
IWQEVLGIHNIGITDDFFRIGGDSILAIKVAHRINKVLKYDMNVADIFRYKTIKKIGSSNELSSKILKSYSLDYNINRNNIIFIHPAVGGSEVYQNLAEMLIDYYNCIGIDNHNLNNTKTINSLNKISQLYISTYEERYKLNGITLLGWSSGGLIALEMATILEKRGYSDINVILLDTVITDEKMSVFKQKQKNKDKIINYLKEINIKNPKSVADAEDQIAKSKISSDLIHTNITLFKAIERDENLEANKSLSKYVQTLKYNNIDSITNNYIKVIDLECNHMNIIETKKLPIAEYIIKNNQVVKKTQEFKSK